jgi:bacillithiol system protein YtxJ
MPIRSLTTATIDAVIAEPGTVVLFKHSPACGRSATVAEDVERFATDHPELTIRVIDVIGQRPLSRDIEARFGVEHESPQVLVLRDGALAWNASHWSITASSLADAVRRAS